MSSFSPDAWLRQSGISPDDEGVSLVVGPLDAVFLASSRDALKKAGYHFGEPSLTDVFIFSTGEAPRRDQTKIGGLPYLHRNDPWPTDSNGNSIPFVGQMNFCNSMDVLQADLPGDVLLVFGNLPTRERSPEVLLVWKSLAPSQDAELRGTADIPCHPKFDSFYGTRWRTENFPNAYTDPRNSKLKMSTEYDAIYASTIFATQISRDPFLLARNRSSMTRSVICCFAPILPASDGPYPFCNEPAPMAERQKYKLRYDDRYRYVPQWLTYGDSTSLYILQNQDGSFTHEFILG